MSGDFRSCGPRRVLPRSERRIDRFSGRQTPRVMRTPGEGTRLQVSGPHVSETCHWTATECTTPDVPVIRHVSSNSRPGAPNQRIH